jgi:FKBP-type peptidyl-prolyl cis-trans isomerase
MKASASFILTITMVLVIVITGCDDPTNPFFRETDFSTVPDPIQYNQYDPVELENGLTYYVIDPGNEESKWQVESRDGVSLFLTLRLSDGDIIQSTYSDNRTQPENINVNSLNSRGLREGVVGMKEGEIRVLIVPPELGFANVSQNSQYYFLREDTLIYEVEIVEIFQ